MLQTLRKRFIELPRNLKDTTQMIESVYKPRRRKNGKLSIARLYRGRYRLDGDIQVKDIALDTPDRQVALKRLREIVLQAQHEKEGLAMPRTQKDALRRKLAEHLDDYLADLKVMGRAETYLRLIRTRNARLIKDCKWAMVKDVTSDSFVAWRSSQQDFAPKTLNEYLNAANGLMNWMVRQRRLESNPLRHVGLVEVRGKQQRRRALTDEEFDRLLAVAGDKRLLYLTAVYTGLRLGELRQLIWSDLELDSERPFIRAREGTTKNKKEAIVPVHPALLEELRAARDYCSNFDGSVFEIGSHSERFFRDHLNAARIERLDSVGRKVDFHALRYTFATKLARQGVPQRLAQELMRHSDPKLTAMIYTDVSQLPTFDAVQKLEWTAGKPAAGRQGYTQIDSQEAVSDSHERPRVDTENGVETWSQVVDVEGISQAWTGPDTNGQMVEAAGVEPASCVNRP